MSKFGENLPDMFEDVPLFSIEAEMAALGSFFLSERALADAVAVLEPQHFTRPAHRLIFQSMARLFKDSKAVDIVTVEDDLKASGNLANIGGPDYLLEVSFYTPSASHSDSYVGTVREKEARRAAVEAARNIERAAKQNRPLQEIEQIGLGIAAKMALGNRRAKDIDMRELLVSQDSRPRPGATSTGNDQLDSIMAYGGLTHGQITLSTAPTGGGKTTWALAVAFMALDRGERVAILSFADNDEEDILERALRYKCGYPCLAKASAHYPEDESGDREYRIALFKQAQDEIYHWDWEVFNGVTNDEGGDFSTAREWLIRKHEEGLSRPDPKPMALAVWDYAQTIDVTEAGMATRKFYDQQSWLAKKMAKLAGNLKIPFIVCAQLTELSEGKEVLAECKVWEKVAELYLRIHENCLEIRKRRRGGRTTYRPSHRYHEQRWCHIPDNEHYSNGLKIQPARSKR